MEFNIEDMIYTAVAYRNTNVAKIARIIGMSPQNLYRKMKRCTLKPEELTKIAKVLGGEYVNYFAFSNGIKIGNLEKHVMRKENRLKAVFH